MSDLQNSTSLENVLTGSSYLDPKVTLCVDGARLFLILIGSASAVESLQSARVGVFTPWKLANTPNGALTIRACFSTFSSTPVPRVEFKIQGVFS